MFMPFAFVLLVLSVPLTGGRLSRLSGLQVRGVGLICLALGLQVLMTTVIPDAPHAVLIALHGASYAVIAWTLWINRRLPGLLLIALGGGTNAAVIALNGGTLPARREALLEAGFTIDPEVFKNSGVVQGPVLSCPGSATSWPRPPGCRCATSSASATSRSCWGRRSALRATCRTRLWPGLDRATTADTDAAGPRRTDATAVKA